MRSWWAFWRVYSLLSRRHGKYLDVEPYEAVAAWISRVDECMEPIDTHDPGVQFVSLWFGPPERESYAECLATKLQVWLEDIDLIAKVARYYDGV